MAAGDSKVSIVTAALAALGEDPISDINQNVKRAIDMKNAFDRVRRRALARRPWRFAKKLAQLAADSEKPAFGYGNAYTLPADHIRPFADVDDSERDWEICGSKLMTDAGGPLNYVYIYDHQDPTQWPPMFVDLLALELASDQCMNITQSEVKQRVVDKRRDEMLGDAGTASAQAANPREWDDDVLLRSRF